MASSSSSVSASSPRRSSRRGDSAGPDFGLSRDETAFGILRRHVLEGDFKAVRDPDNVMKKIWIRSGKEREDCVDGVDLIKEDGFAVKKYEAFWRKEMEELDDVIVAWGHKLPAEAKSHLDKSLFKQDIQPVRVVAEVSPASGKEDTKKRRGRPKKMGRPKKVRSNADDDEGDGADGSEASGKRRGRPKKARTNADDDEGDGSKASGKGGRGRSKKARSSAIDGEDDGLTPELVALRREWFQALEEGQHRVGVEDAKEAESTKKRRARAAETRDLFVHNVAGCPRAAAYKQAALDPLARHIVAKVDAYVASQATILRNEFLDNLLLSNYKFSEADEVKATGEDKSVELADEGKGNDGD